MLTGWLYAKYHRPHKSGYPSFINHRTAAAAAVFRSARHSRENNKIDDKLCLLTSTKSGVGEGVGRTRGWGYFDVTMVVLAGGGVGEAEDVLSA